MFIKKHFLFLILNFISINLSYSAFAKVFDKKCGNYKYIVSIHHKNDQTLRKFKLYSQDQQGEKTLFYETKQGHLLFSACVKNTKNKYLMIFQDKIGLNGEPEDTYGVFDPVSNKMLINPKDWPHGNQEIIEKLLGYKPPILLLGNEPYFCCHSTDL